MKTDKKLAAYLINQDPKMAQVIGDNIVIERNGEKEPFMALVDAIVSQQISARVADVLVSRLKEQCKGQVNPKSLGRLKDEEIRALGISSAKIKYLRALSAAVSQGSLDLANISKKSDEEIVAELLRVKGIGPWTAEMFLIFCLEREDVFSCLDGALMKAISHWYYKDKEITKKQLLTLSKKWAPYRSYACIYLWESLKRF